MKSKIVDNDNVREEFPCLVLDTSDNMVLLATGKSLRGGYYGTVVRQGDKDINSYQVGSYHGPSDAFATSVPFVPFTGILQLSNN